MFELRLRTQQCCHHPQEADENAVLAARMARLDDGQREQLSAQRPKQIRRVLLAEGTARRDSERDNSVEGAEELYRARSGRDTCHRKEPCERACHWQQKGCAGHTNARIHIGLSSSSSCSSTSSSSTSTSSRPRTCIRPRMQAASRRSSAGTSTRRGAAPPRAARSRTSQAPRQRNARSASSSSRARASAAISAASCTSSRQLSRSALSIDLESTKTNL
mmetsp:Transcript_37342/g.92526  ORF Transcript_37342/g.92526 Transcript_37342/m.92526 type:complete len:219 (+) Transcript_37342:1948-2604(+)